LGFRGEALPSILAVSKVAISSRTQSSPHGYSFTIEAGEVLKRSKKGMPMGTIVEVADLFFNTPARKKFLKTSATEQRHAMDVISRYAIACPQVRFTLRINGRYLLSFASASDLKDRVASVLGGMRAKDLIPLNQEKPGITVYGLIAPPSETRSNRGGIYTFVNSRSVRDALLGAAVIEGYSGMLMKGRYPIAVVFIDIDPHEVDVNVHPSKAEVRFRHAGAVFGIIASTIGEALAPSSVQKDYSFGIAPTHKDTPRHDIKEGHCEEPKASWQSRGVQGQDGNLFDERPSLQPVPGFYSSKAVIGIFHNTYVLFQDDLSLYILDQHAAHERVTFERLKTVYASGIVKKQLLLNPIILELSRPEFSVFEEIAGYIAEIGIEAEPFGSTTIAVRAVPHLLAGSDISRIIHDLLHEVMDGMLHEKRERVKHLEELMASIACHASVRAGKALSPAEAAALLRELDEVGSPLTCPHGRPLYKKIGRDEIERWIGRRP
jgi:DNA mismatch repair protein MutL